MSLADDFLQASSAGAFAVLRRTDERVGVSIWWLETTGEPPAAIYAWIIPSRDEAASTWSTTGAKRKEVAGKKRRLVRTSITMEGNRAYALLTALTHGQSFADACAYVGIGASSTDHDVRLGEDTHAVLPPAYFAGASFFREPGRRSPREDMGCYCSRIASLQKLVTVLQHEERPGELLKWLLTQLDEQTGLGFRGPAADAIGSIEVFAFPSLDSTQRRLVKIAQHRDDGSCAVKVTIMAPESAGNYLVHLRTKVLGDVVFDEVAEVIGKPAMAQFHPPWAMDSAFVRIWHRNATEQPWTLWHDEEQNYVREIQLTTNLIGLTGEVRSEWLEGLKGTRAENRAAAVARFRQVYAQQRPLSSTRADWEQATRNARALAGRMFPERSGAKFFSKGWEGDSKLALAEWLKDELSNHFGSIVLADPYFDVPGLELLSRVSGGANGIAVLTCTQVPSDDDPNSPQSRSERLRRAARKWDAVLRGTQIRLLDLQSVGGGNRRLFHDRYVLFYDGAGRPTRGFNLSNSIQHATRTSPLLVTPIPMDTLDQVSDHVETLLAPASEVATIEQLYPPPREVDATRADVIPEESAVQLLKLLAAVDERPDYLAQPCPSARTRLEDELRVVARGRVKMEWSDEKIRRVADAMQGGTLNEQSEIWCGLAEVLARMHDAEHVVEDLARTAGDTLRNFLVQYMVALSGSGVERGWLAPNRSETITLAYMFDSEFVHGLDVASRLIEHHHWSDCVASWPVRYAASTLVDLWSEDVPLVVSELRRQEDPGKGPLSALASALAKRVQLGSVLPMGYCEAGNPFLRALVAMVTWRQLRRGQADESLLRSLLPRYDTTERRHILARAIYDLRIAENRRDPDDDSTVSRRRAFVLTELLSTYVNPVTTDDVMPLLPQLSGPLLGSAAASTDDEFLAPLRARGLLTGDDNFLVWDRTLSAQTEGKPDNFYEARDIPLLSTWGRTFWLAEGDTRRGVLDRATEQLKRAKRTVREPFLESRDYDRWRQSADALLWWMLRLVAACDHRPNNDGFQELLDVTQGLVAFIDSERLIASAIDQLGPAAAAARERWRALSPATERGNAGAKRAEKGDNTNGGKAKKKATKRKAKKKATAKKK